MALYRNNNASIGLCMLLAAFSASGAELEPIVSLVGSDLPEAKNIILQDPVLEDNTQKGSMLDVVPTVVIHKRHEQSTSIVDDKQAPQLPTTVLEAESVKEDKKPKPFVLLGTEIPPATSTRIAWSPDQSLKGLAIATPVLVVNGRKPGPVVCLTAAIHGDELNGIEIVRRVLYELDPEDLSGTVIGVPIVNLQGFQRSSRYLADRRDLNRFFPGNAYGSSASRLAHSFFQDVILRCDALVDLHTGSFNRTNMPQLRADTKNPKVLALAQSFGATVIVHGDGVAGTLRRAAVEAGVPAVTLEAGESSRLQKDAVAHGVKAIETLLEKKSMLSSMSFWSNSEAVYYQSTWIRADQGGVLFSRVSLGDRIHVGKVLGVVTDPITNVSSEIIAPYKGRVIGMALNQVVMPGFAAFHLGIESNKKSNDSKPVHSLNESLLTGQPEVVQDKSPEADPEVMDAILAGDEDFN